MYVFWFLLLATCPEGKTTETATCESPGLGEPARVTCQFSENVAENGDVSAVLLRRFPIHNKAGNLVQKVVECHRYIGNVLDCLPKDGYSVIGNVSDQLIINITSAKSEHQSLFSCELVRRQTTVQVAVCILKYEGTTTETATCEATWPGEPARVTCHFNENVAEAGDVNAVLLRRFPLPNEGGNVVQKVVECHRYLDKVFDCLPKNGYGVIGTVSDQLIINITRAQEERQSLYSCDLVRGHIALQVAVCVFKYKDALSNESTTSAPPFVQEPDDQRKEVSDNCTKDDTGYHLRTIILTVLVLLLSAFVIFYMVRQQRRKRKKDMPDSNRRKGERSTRETRL